jgi:hypothetical protein
LNPKSSLTLKTIEIIGLLFIGVLITGLIAVFVFYFPVPAINITVENLRSHPQSQPLVVSGYSEQIQHGEKPSVCVSISEVKMATNFEPSNVVQRHIMTNTRLLIDKQVVPFWDVSISMPLLGIDVIDDQGNTLGSYGSPITFCAKWDLEVGSHMATVITKSMSGEPIIYSWIVEVVP